jgi:hypothetical protein
MKTQINNELDFLNVTLSQVSQIYVGKDNCCRCGCGGTYIATSFMKDARSEVNDSLAQRRLNKALKLVRDGSFVEYGGTYVNVVSGNNRAICIYFDDIKL